MSALDDLPDPSLVPLTVAAFAITGHQRRKEQWSLVAPVSREEVHVFELKGTYDTFEYVHSVSHVFMGSPRLRGGCEVGRIRADQLNWLELKLKEVPIVWNDEDFDGQDWVVEAVYLLKEYGGIIHKGVGERMIREELEAELERWDCADDIFYEREVRPMN